MNRFLFLINYNIRNKVVSYQMDYIDLIGFIKNERIRRVKELERIYKMYYPY